MRLKRLADRTHYSLTLTPLAYLAPKYDLTLVLCPSYIIPKKNALLLNTHLNLILSLFIREDQINQ
jgi:hypothetical protein